MAHRHFYREEVRRRAIATIQQIEAKTAVQVVVALRSHAGDYRAADYLAGFAVALGVLAALLYLPIPFGLHSVPIDTFVGFVVGAAVCARTDSLRRLLTPRRRRAEATHRAACEAFLDGSLSKTKSRLCVLVFVGMLEHCVEIISDVGVDVAALGTEWTQAVAALHASLAGVPDVEEFILALQRLGPPLQRVHPRGTTPVEELPDELPDASGDRERRP
jgi:uncharacterized membrane protein